MIFILRFERIVLFAITHNVMTRESGGRNSHNQKYWFLNLVCNISITNRPPAQQQHFPRMKCSLTGHLGRAMIVLLEVLSDHFNFPPYFILELY